MGESPIDTIACRVSMTIWETHESVKRLMQNTEYHYCQSIPSWETLNYSSEARKPQKTMFSAYIGHMDPWGVERAVFDEVTSGTKSKQKNIIILIVPSRRNTKRFEQGSKKHRKSRFQPILAIWTHGGSKERFWQREPWNEVQSMRTNRSHVYFH